MKLFFIPLIHEAFLDPFNPSSFSSSLQKSSGQLGNLSAGLQGSKNGTADSTSEDVGKVLEDIVEELSNHNER